MFSKAIISLLVSAVFYKCSRYFSPYLFHGYPAMKRADQRDWDTRYASMLHSALLVYFGCHEVIATRAYYQEAEHPMLMVFRTSRVTNMALGMSLGFFVVDMAATLKYNMGGTEMALHHVGSFSCVAIAAFSGQCHLYVLWMLTTEATTPFVNIRWWLDKAGLKAHPLYFWNGIAIVLSWMLFRLALFPPFFYSVWTHRDELHHLNIASRTLLLVFPVVLISLNLFWFQKIVKGIMKMLGMGQAKPLKKE
ncbi:MAG: hypothetical protein WDW38_009494 [Sanguina aurantia]